MAYNDNEIAEFLEPIELYTLTRGSTNWYYTSFGEDVVYASNTFQSVPIKRSRIETSQEIKKGALDLTVSRRVEFINQFIPGSPTDVFTIVVTRIHVGDTDPSIIYQGRVLNVKFKESSATITCQSIQSALRRPGLRRFYQLACPHVLYGGPCGADNIANAVPATLTNVTNRVLTSADFIISIDPAFDANHFVGGYVEFNQSGLVTTRFITDHDNGSGTITVNLAFFDLTNTDSVTAYPGCDRLTATCSGKFSNINNFGGFPFIPIKNPMNGTPVF